MNFHLSILLLRTEDNRHYYHVTTSNFKDEKLKNLIIEINSETESVTVYESQNPEIALGVLNLSEPLERMFIEGVNSFIVMGIALQAKKTMIDRSFPLNLSYPNFYVDESDDGKICFH
jgi:hypothetical protein